MEEINKENEKQKKFHLVITDNETGETHIDCDTKCIIGAFEDGNRSGSLAIAACNAIELAGSISAARGVIKRVLSEKPKIAALVEMEELFSKLKEE